jgi:hypothetical protein
LGDDESNTINNDEDIGIQIQSIVPDEIIYQNISDED